MNQKTFASTAAVIFLLIAILHVLRILYGWEAMIGTASLPMWVSWLALLLAGFLSYQGFRLGKKA